MNPFILSIPVLSAIAGFCFNKICAYYLLNLYLPKKKNAIAQLIAQKAERMMPFEKIENGINNPALIEKTMPSIEAHIDEFLSVKLPQEIPMLAMFVGNKTTDKIKEVFVNQLRMLFPKVMTDIVGDLKKSFNIKETVYNEINNTDVSQVFKKELSKPLQKFCFCGLLLGLLIGLINLSIFYFLS